MAKSIVTTTVAFRNVSSYSNIWYVSLGDYLVEVDILTNEVTYTLSPYDMLGFKNKWIMHKGKYIMEDVAIKWSGNCKDKMDIVFIVGTSHTVMIMKNWNALAVPKNWNCKSCMRARLCAHIGGCAYEF